MLKKKLILLIGVCLVMGFTTSAFSATTLKKLGEHPFYMPPLTSVADLQTMVQKRGANIEEGFKKAGSMDAYAAFKEQFATAKIETIKVQPGDKVQWMLFRKYGKGPVDVAKDVTWGGKAPYEAFRFTAQKDGKVYEFIVPFACGNVALKSVSKPVAPVVPANQPPSCSVKLSSAEVQCGKTIVVDASGSSDTDGKVVSVTFILTDASGKKIAEKVDNEAPFVQEFVVPCDAPKYSVQVIATDDKGAKSTNSAGCTQTFAAVKPMGGPVVALGYMHQFDPGNYAFVKVGYDYAFSEKLHAMGLVGGFYQFHGYDGESAITVDGILNYYITPEFALGGGLGYWSGDDGRLDLIANAMYKLPWEMNGIKSSIFIEGRCDVDELDNMDLSGRLGMGVMLHF